MTGFKLALHVAAAAGVSLLLSGCLAMGVAGAAVGVAGAAVGATAKGAGMVVDAAIPDKKHEER